MLTRFEFLRSFSIRLAAALGFAGVHMLMIGCDGAAAPNAKDQSAADTRDATNYLAYECSTRAQNSHLGEIILTPLQMLNTLEYAFNPHASDSFTAVGLFGEKNVFDSEAIANVVSPNLLNHSGPLRDVTAAFFDYRSSAEGDGLCDLSFEPCAKEFLTHFNYVLSLRPLSEERLQALTTQFIEAPVETLAEFTADKLARVDLAGLTKSEIAAIRISLLMQYRLPGYDYPQWTERYPLATPAGRVELANLLIDFASGFKPTVADFFGRYFSYSDRDLSDSSYRFADEVLDTLYLQVLGANHPVFEGTFTDLFTSNMALVAEEDTSVYRSEGAIDFGLFTGLDARKEYAYWLFQTEGRPGVFSQLAMLKHSPLKGRNFYKAFTCSSGIGGRHQALYGDEYVELFVRLDDEEAAQGFEYPRLDRLARAIELGDDAFEPSCSWCHMPTLSIDRALTVFNENGEMRSVLDGENESTMPLAPYGQFYRVNGGISHDELIAFDDLTDLFSQVVETDMAKQCFANSWIESALQVPDEFNCNAPSLYKQFDASGGNIRTLLFDIIASDLFTSNGQSL